MKDLNFNVFVEQREGGVLSWDNGDKSSNYIHPSQGLRRILCGEERSIVVLEMT